MTQRTILYADTGKVLTNGIDYGKQIFLAETADSSSYYEITVEEYREILLSQKKDGDA